jgi:organic hydroperoxide reductase OsmC/OhrA
MADIESITTCEDGFDADSTVGDFKLSIDATGEEGPTPNEVLVADYASCYTFAFRAGAQRNAEEFEEPGEIRTEADADLDDDDDLEAIRFTIHVETEYGEEDADALKELADDICHVHAALREGLHADVTIHTGQEF